MIADLLQMIAACCVCNQGSCLQWELYESFHGTRG